MMYTVITVYKSLQLEIRVRPERDCALFKTEDKQAQRTIRENHEHTPIYLCSYIFSYTNMYVKNKFIHPCIYTYMPMIYTLLLSTSHSSKGSEPGLKNDGGFFF